jgi:nuclear pore complex protein Nup98-Nup96
VFGGTSTGAFGSAQKSPFGSSSTTTTGAFGAPTSGFGGGFGSSTTQQSSTSQQVGTGNPLYQSTGEIDGTSSSNYISICRMPAYQHKSHEELRYEDYLKRTNPAAAQVAAAQNAPSSSIGGPTCTFGSMAAPSTGGGMFGSTAQPSAGGFGSISGFGSSSSSFGSQATPGFGTQSAFGASSAPSTGSFGGFGQQQTTPNSGGVFGGAPATSTFGTPASAGQSGGAFGGPSTGFGAPTISSFGTPSTGFGSTSAFGAPSTPAPSTDTSGFGFGSSGASGSFGSSAFGAKTATSTGAGFGFGTSTSTPASSGFSFGGSAPSQPASTGASLFGGAAATPASSGFSFSSTSTKPTISSGFSFGASGSGGFGASTGSAFGASGTQPSTGTSLFACTTPASTTGGFGFRAPSSSGATTTSLFGSTAEKPTGLFGSTSTHSSTPSTGLFGSTSASFGSSFGTVGGFGSSAPSTSMFGSFGLGSTPGITPPSTSLFSAPGPNIGTAATPQNLVAAPDVNPYGSGSYGAGLVEQNVKAALDTQALKAGPSTTSRLGSLSQHIGLPRGSMDAPVVSRRHISAATRQTIPVAFGQGLSFKGSKSLSNLVRPGSDKEISTISEANEQNGVEFNFTSSLFKNIKTKNLVIERSNSKSNDTSLKEGETALRATVVPVSDEFTESLPVSSNDPLQVDENRNMEVSFRSLLSKQLLKLRINADCTFKEAKSQIKSHLSSSSSADLHIIFKGRILHDSVKISALDLRQSDILEIAEFEEPVALSSPPVSKTSPSKQSLVTTTLDKPGRFLSYNEFLESALHEKKEHDSSEVNNLCPVLTKNDYYMVPSMKDLSKLSNDELSRVKKFTVGCKGLGSVEWLGETDVRGLNIDELVRFDKKEVIVYPSEEEEGGFKHEIGHGLNKPAIVELLGIFPPKRNGPESDKKYRGRVMKRTSEIGAEFLDYFPEKGVWRFRVEHFSRYGIDDEDESDDADADDKMLSRQSVVKMTPSGIHSKIQSSFIASSEEHVEMFKRSLLLTGRNHGSVVSISGGDSMPLTPVTCGMPLGSVHESVEPEPEYSQDGGSHAVVLDSVHSYDVKVPRIEVQPWGISVDTSKLPSCGKSATYKLKLSTSQGPSQADLGFFLARSFRCSWGPHGELVNVAAIGALKSNIASHTTISIQHPLVESLTIKSAVEDALKLHYECTTLAGGSNPISGNIQDDTVSHFGLSSLDNGIVNTIHKYVAYFEAVYKKQPSCTHLKQVLVWKLVQACWGQEHVQTSDKQGAVPLALRDDPREFECLENFQAVDLRREAISRWFEEALVLTNPPIDSRNSTHDTVLRLLCQHRIVEAAEIAMEIGDFRLATLLSQAQSYEGSDFRTLINNQLNQWNENGSLEVIEEELVLIYSLIGGSVEVFTAKKKIPWLEALALVFWFKRGPATPLRDAMHIFFEAVKKSIAQAPTSVYDINRNDVLMELMKLYCNESVSLCSVLSPSGYSTGSHLNYEMAWHLYAVLRAIGYKLEPKWEYHVQHNFLRQLEQIGLWQQAVYVSLTLSDPLQRELTCRQILHRNITLNMTPEEMQKLCIKLALPIEWLQEAKAFNAGYWHRSHEQIAYLVGALKYDAAHDCVMKHVAIKCLFTGDTNVLLSLLHELEPAATQGLVSNWDLQGGMVLEYLRLSAGEGLEVGFEASFLERLQHLSKRITSWKKSRSIVTCVDVRSRAMHEACASSMLVSLSAKAVEIQRLLMNQGVIKPLVCVNDAPKQLSMQFLEDLCTFNDAKGTNFAESYRTSNLLALCSSFVEWRSLSV